jgi:hypothetical protein
LINDGLDRADEVLVGAHASRDAVHDDADFVCFHILELGWPQRGAKGAKLRRVDGLAFAILAPSCG